MPHAPLAQAIDAADFYNLSVVRSGDLWQANLQRERGINSFRVCHGATASEAIAALFEPVPVYREPSFSTMPPPPF